MARSVGLRRDGGGGYAKEELFGGEGCEKKAEVVAKSELGVVPYMYIARQEQCERALFKRSEEMGYWLFVQTRGNYERHCEY